MNKNPFAIRKSPVSIITAQAVTIDDYVQRTLDDTDRVSFCATTNKKQVLFIQPGTTNSISEEGIAKVNATSKLVLRRRGDSAVEFYNAASRLYVLHFVEVAEIGNHRVSYFMLNLADGKRGGAPDKEVGRMIVAVITQYLEEYFNQPLSFCFLLHLSSF